MNNEFNIVLGGKIDAQSVNTSIKSIENKINSINLKATIDLSDVQKQVNKINLSGSQIGSSKKGASGHPSLGISQELVESIKESSDAIDKITIKTDDLGNVTKVVTTEYNSLNEVITKTWSAGAEQLDDFTTKVETNTTGVKQNLKLQEQNKQSIYKLQGAIASYGNQSKLSKKEVANFNKELGNISSMQNEIEKSKAIEKLNSDVKNAANSTGILGQSFSKAMVKYVTWLGIATIVAQLLRAIKSMVSQVSELDAALVELNKVSNLTKEQLNEVKDVAFDLGKEVGRTGTEVINAITEFKRAGYELEDSIRLAEIALIMTNVAEGITDAGDAANYLVSILKGANLDIAYASRLLDELNEISNTSAVNFDALADMTQRIAGTMNTLGNTVEETMALITGAYEVLQDQRVAKGISIIGLRISGLNENLEEEAGLASQVGEALQKYAGIDVFDKQTGQLRDTFDILEELASKWDGLTKNAQTYLLTTLAGKNRADVLASIMQNWEGVESAMESALDSTGSALEEQEAYLESIEGKQEALNNAWQELSDATIDSDFIKFLVDAAKTITEVATKMGGLHNVLLLVIGTMGAIKGIKFFNSIAQGTTVIVKSTSAVKAYAAANSSATVAVTRLKASISALSLVLSAVTFIYSAISSAISAYNEAVQEKIDKAKEDIETAQTTISTLKTLREEYASLSALEDKSVSATNRLINIKKELIKLYGSEAEALDLVNGNYEEQIRKMQELEFSALKEEKLGLIDLREATKSQLGSLEARLDNEASSGGLYDNHVKQLMRDAKTTEEKYNIAVAERDKLLKEKESGDLDKTESDDLKQLQEFVTKYEELKKINDQIAAVNEKMKFTQSSLATDVGLFLKDMAAFENLSLEEQAKALEDMEKRVNAFLTDPAYEYNKEAVDEIRASWDELSKTVKNTDFALIALNDKLDALKKQKKLDEEELKIQEKLLKVEKAREELAKAKQKRIRVFRAGRGFVYEEDAEAVQKANETLQEALQDAEQTDLDKAIKAIEELQEMYNQAQLDQANAGLTTLRDYFRNQQNLDRWMNMSIEEKKKLLDSFITTRDWNAPVTRESITNWVPTNASGSERFKGGATLVGEHGPELVNLPSGSEILSNSRTMKLHSIVDNPSAYIKSSGKGTMLQFNGPLNFPNVRDGSDAQSFIDALLQIGNKGIPSLT